MMAGCMLVRGGCLCLLLCCLLAGAVSAQEWAPGQRLQLASESGVKNPKICPASTGGFHAVYKVSSEDWRLDYRRYFGGSLSAPTAIPHTGWPGGTADVAEAGNGDIWYTWENWAGTAEREQIWAARSSNGGVTWQSWNITQYQYGPGEDGQAKHPSIAPYGPPGSATMVSATWRAVTNELYSGVFNGTSWSSHQGMGTYVDNAYSTYGICQSPADGSVYRVYGRRIAGVWQACIRRFNGASWEPEIVVSTHSSNDFICRLGIAINHLGRIMVTWENNDTIYARHYVPEAGWLPQVEVTGGTNAAVTAIPGRNDFYVVYVTGGGVRGRRYAGGKWESTAKSLNDGLGGVHRVDCDVCADSGGYVYATWETHPDPGPVAYYAVYGGFVHSDTTAPPAPASVMDEGAGTDSTTDLYASWSPVSDPESGIDHYEYAVGTSPGGYDVRFWTTTGAATHVYAHGLSLDPGATYYISARAVNKAGLEGPWTSSDGILCDPSINTAIFGITTSLSRAGIASDTPMLARSAGGGMHLVYRESSGFDYRVGYRRLVGEEWTPLEFAANLNPSAFYPDVAEDPAGNVHCTFTNPGGREELNIYEAVRTAGGWSTPAMIAGSRLQCWYPKLASGVGSEQVHLTVNGDNFAYNAKHAARTAAGWGPLQTISSGSSASTRYGMPDIATDASGGVSVVWITSSNQVFSARRSGGVWSSPALLASHPGAFVCHPRIAVGPSGLAHIVYADHNTTPDPAVYYVRQTAPGSWAGPVPVANGFYPAIAVDTDGRVHIAYGKGRGGNPDIYHKVLTGADWSQEQNLSNNAGISERPALRADVDGFIHIAWQDYSPGAGAILYRRTVPEPPSCAYAKGLPENSVVDLMNKVVTAVFPGDGCFYIEEPNRSSGIRVQASTMGRVVGEVVNVTGAVTTRKPDNTNPSERQIIPSSVTMITRGMYLEPLAMTCRAVGGGPVGTLVPGVRDGVGLNNMGMLVRIAGKVTLKISNYIYVDDGSKIQDISGRIGVMVKCPNTSIPVNAGDVVSVTGVVVGSVPTGWTTNRRLLQIRDYDDLVRH